ncbi:MAG: PASTA domain-containing protein [bacterium]|nr:PASTA domain-containing protein [bacterium]MBU1428040.1 PASTA domain-containing protein [bacterium]MBU2440245.1 PASTA domain-containing protein [bacterium]
MDWIGKIFRVIFKSFLTTAFIIFAVIAGATCAFLVFQNVFDVSDTVVPSVIGDELNIAQEKLYDAGLKIYISGEEFDERIPQNKIIAQDPASGAKVKKNREIHVVVSKGSKVIALDIPDLRNKELKEATALIEEYGLILDKITYTNHFSVPKDVVIAQTPEPGNINSNSKNVNLLVSKGPY